MATRFDFFPFRVCCSVPGAGYPLTERAYKHEGRVAQSAPQKGKNRCRFRLTCLMLCLKRAPSKAFVWVTMSPALNAESWAF